MSNDGGGPAFPVPSYVNASGETHESRPQGMSLRDYFAGQALCGIIQRCMYDIEGDPLIVHADNMRTALAEFAIATGKADAASTGGGA